MNDETDDDGDFVTEQLQPEDTLEDKELSDVLDRGYSPPDRRPHAHPEHENLSERLSDEEPDVFDDVDAERDPDYPSGDEIGDRRAGRLVAPDLGTERDVDAQMLASDAGVDGAGASAEEAAIHVIDDDQ
ncbi:hypothetical protein GOHSU_59_00120 [Gordonia hirsuta DSM 44140 = NBRC 16056]|uniref:DUF5709 domain-containing protein n=1 Tax=Gordonia hirsuta DSM 44140 = NBRC 16056 TaxID=1121927 RepID=L7LDD4_9ACTN|nr:DUF5709 domain-containing protein [Gordonia hirsuta]GAC58919.1 hypothetical protein GOHSU_59_00120 [Gordonia hirsuta DSM 44140 = NBRC 16056]